MPKDFQKIKTKIGTLDGPVSGQRIGDSVKMANILAEQYNKMFSVPSTSNEILRERTTARLEDIRFSENDIMHAIDDMKVNAASGPDGFPSIYLKQCI